MYQKRQFPHLVKLHCSQYKECCQKLFDTYSDDLKSNLSTELKQFHLYIQHKFSATKATKARFSHAE